MILARNLNAYNRRLILKDISRFLSNTNSKDQKRSLIENGPSLKEFIQTKSPEPIDPAIEIENKIFLENLKRINEQADNDFTETDKKGVYFEIHGCQMNLNDTEVAYSILAQTGL